MQVSSEVDQELEGFVRDRILRIATLFDPSSEQIGSIPYAPEDVYILLALPPFRTGELTQLWRVIGDGVREVQRRRPPHLVSDLVSPGRDGGEGARSSWFVENRTEGR